MPVWVHKWVGMVTFRELVGGERKPSWFLGDGLVIG